MSNIKLARGTVAIVLSVGALAGAIGGYFVSHQIRTSRPTCANAVNNFFALLPERDRYLLDNHNGGRDRYVRSCREGRWSHSMKRCWVGAASTSDIDACPNEWLNAATICEQMKREAIGLARRCRIDSGTLDCARVRGFSPSIKACIEGLRDTECRDVEQAARRCQGVLSSPS